MDAGGRATHGAVAEDAGSDYVQDVRQKIAPAFFAFPPSRAVVFRERHDCMDA
jgi:hypothetical protein